MTRKRFIGIITMPIVYFGLILIAALFVAMGLIGEVPIWALPIFAVITVGIAMFVGDIRWVDVVLVFLICILLFPLGSLLLIGTAGKLEISQTLSIILREMRVAEWLMTVSPLVAAALAYFGFGHIRKNL